MVIESRFSVPVPNWSIQKWILCSCCDPLPDKKVWIDADNPDTRYLTLSSARLLAKRIAVGLLEHGLRPGDRVLVFSGNNVVFPAVMLGIWMAGGVFTGANPSYVARELAYQLEDSGARIMLAASKSWEVALQAASMVGMDCGNVFAFDGSIPGLDQVKSIASTEPQHWTRLVASEEKGEMFVWDEPLDSSTTTCTLNYSSGTVCFTRAWQMMSTNS